VNVEKEGQLFDNSTQLIYVGTGINCKSGVHPERSSASVFNASIGI